MRLYEVGEHVREGLSISRGNGIPCISLGLDVETNDWHSIQLGNSIRRELKHPDDGDSLFRLMRGKLDPHAPHILKFLAMYAAEPDDELAFVVVHRCELPGVPMNEVVSAYKHNDPEHLLRTRNTGSGYDTFLFRPGDGLYITWDHRLTTQGYDLRFVITWDGQTLRQLASRGAQKRLRPVVSEGSTLSA